MHRPIAKVVLCLAIVLGLARPGISAPDVAGWQAAAAVVAINDMGARPVTVRLSEIVQTTGPLTGHPEALPRINPPEVDKEAIPETHLTPSFIPQHFAVQDGSVASSMPQPLAPVRQRSFVGLSQTRSFPPDPTIAVGPTHLVLAVNTSLGFYTKTGVKKFQSGFGSWFAKLPDDQNAFIFDPRVMYDQYAQHFIVVVAAYREKDSRSWYFMAVSKTSNPEGEWAQWELDMGLNGKTITNNFADFPGIGLDQGGIYLTANMFSFTSNNFVTAKIRVLDKAKVYQFGAITWVDYFGLHDATGQLASTIQPVRSYGTVDREFLISDNEDTGGTKLTLWSVQNPSAARPLLLKKSVKVSGYKFPPDAPEKGGGAAVNTGDARFSTNGVFAGGFIYAIHPVAFDWGSGEVSAIRLYQLTTAGAVVQEITFGADKLYYFYPALDVDSRGNIVVLFNRCGANELIGIYYTGRKLTDVAGKLQNSALLKMSAANYQQQDDFGRNRWGDYNTATLDLSDDSVWLYSEFAQGATVWSTQVGKVRFN